MTQEQLRGNLNTLLIMAMLVIGSLVQSEIGGPGSIYNSINVSLITVFLILNHDVDPRLVHFFAAPVAFLLLSVAANIETLHVGGYRTAVAATLGYALFTLRPVPLHRPLLKFLMTAFLVGGLALSFVVTVQRNGFDFGLTFGNANFNINPNSAALFFFQGMVLALALLPGSVAWPISILYMFLMITTWSRAGVLCTILALFLHSIVTHSAKRRRTVLAPVVAIGSNWRVWLAVAVVGALATRYTPEAVDTLMLRFIDNEGRAHQWEQGWAGIQTAKDWLIGSGPQTLNLRIDGTAHNSYIDAIGNSGVFFLMTTLIALFLWTRRLAIEGSTDMLWIVPPVMVYGMVENILFNGISTVWLMLMILSLTHRSQQAKLDVSLLARARLLRRVQSRQYMNPDAADRLRAPGLR
jgi:hypothetical protein